MVQGGTANERQFHVKKKRKMEVRGSGVAHSVKCLTPDFRSGYDMRAVTSSPVMTIGLGLAGSLLEDSLPLLLPQLVHVCVISVSVSLSL